MSVISSPALFMGEDGYQISRSVRLRSSASAYFNRTPASATNRRTWTWSAWVKRGSLSTTYNQYLFSAVPSSSVRDAILFNTSSGLSVFANDASSAWLVTTQVFRDPSAWYHIIVAVDTTQATSSNRIKVYLNGSQITSFSTATYPTQNYDWGVNNTVRHTIGDDAANAPTGLYHFDGYLTEVNFIDGQALTPSSFGENDSITGVWKPKKYAGTYGTNGFYLNFSDNSNNTAATIGKDSSGNGNNWTPNNISVTTGSTYDSMLDTPTPYADGGNGRGNYAVLNPLSSTYAVTFSEANLKGTFTGGNSSTAGSTISVSSGKWYAEMTIGSTNVGSRTYPLFGICNPKTFGNPDFLGDGADEYSYSCDGYKTNNGTATSVGTTLTTNDVMMIAFDADSGKIWWGKNGTWIASGDPANGTNAMYSSIPSSTYVFAICGYTSTNAFINFGQRPFAYTPPSGFKALNTQNLPDSTIKNGAQYMAATLWTGNGTTQSISNGTNNTTGVTFKPDWVWIKERSEARSNWVWDSVRGGSLALSTNGTNADTSMPDMTGITSTGFGVSNSGASDATNKSSQTYVGWQWQAGQGTTSSNTSGSITSTVSVNATAGFSIVSYTGTGANATVGHGLGVAPSFIIVFNRSGSDHDVYHTSTGNNSRLFLNTTAAASSPAGWNATSPTSSVFSLGSGYGDVNTNGTTYVAYCWAAVAGYSAFGSYTGNGSSDGPFVYCGFRPRYVLRKRTDTSAYWVIHDSSRDPYNATQYDLYPNDSLAEATDAVLDFTSNGFKIRGSGANINASGGTYIYAAFAENPFKNSLAR